MVERAWRAFLAAAADWLLGLIDDVQLVGCAVAMLRLGCDSTSLARVAAVREHDRGELLAGLYDAFSERGLEFPLSGDALKLSADYVLAQMDAGTISPEDASAKLWSISDRDPDLRFPELLELRELAISWSLYEAPECDFDLDPDQWRSELVSLARTVLDRGGIEPGRWLEEDE